MKVSVIIAVYNAEKYLREALDSIFTQTLPLKDYEVIIIDDGSTDSTPEILKQCKKQYKNCQCISQKNQGVSAARNAGMSFATGDYLYFLDGDDIVEEDALKQLYNRAVKQDADVVIARYDIFNEYTISPVTNLNAITKLKTIDKYDPRLLWSFTVWNKLFRRELVESEELQFPEISYSEDGVFTMHMILHAEKITGLDQIVIHYRRSYSRSATSITASISPGKIRGFLSAHELIRHKIMDSAMRDYPGYGTFENTLQNETKVALFYHEFQVKELHTIYNQFYCHYWNSDEASRELTLEHLDWKLSHTEFATRQEIFERDPELLTFSKSLSASERASQAKVNICLYGTPEQKEEFLHTLASLCSSNYVSYKITMPSAMKSFVHEAGLAQDNFYYLWTWKKDRETFYQRATAKYPSEYVLFTEPYFLYTYNALSVVMKRMKTEMLDYCSESVYCWNEEQQTFVLSSRGTCFPPLPTEEPSVDAAITEEEAEEVLPEPELVDFLLANKVFKSSFIVPLLGLPAEQIFSRMYTKGRHVFFNHKSVLLKKTSITDISLATKETE